MFDGNIRPKQLKPVGNREINTLANDTQVLALRKEVSANNSSKPGQSHYYNADQCIEHQMKNIRGP